MENTDESLSNTRHVLIQGKGIFPSFKTSYIELLYFLNRLFMRKPFSMICYYHITQACCDYSGYSC